MTIGELKYFIEGMGLVDSTPSLAQWKNIVSKIEEVHAKGCWKAIVSDEKVSMPIYPNGRMTTYI